ncbi:MAG: hypothetical protein Q9228_003297 [Teloschistes exilis]
MIPRLLLSLLLSAVASRSLAGPGQQKPLVATEPEVETSHNSKKLHGRFLHITDFHLDPFYGQFSSTDDDDACHWGQGSAGIFGAEKTDCDSPTALINATFQWINDNIRDSIDFVVWTGDSARHDNDELIPRSEGQVIRLNEILVNKFVEVFGKDDNINDTDPTNDFIIPIVPNFGNNDILPHNIFDAGPNQWTEAFARVWQKFIPEEQRHSFERGGWFFVEVIPDKLAVFSLNTLYFFNSNTAVDGCADESEPGYEHFEWLRIQLQFIRQRGMKAILTGHVPPARTESKQSWDETCWQKYTLWLQQYRDVIVGGMYGHMNIDHFMLQDNDQIEARVISGESKSARSSPHSADFSIQKSAEYLTELRYGWSELPDNLKRHKSEASRGPRSSSNTDKKRRSKHDDFLEKIGGEWGERYSVTLVSASVVPNYFPTMRVFEYNITGMEQVTGKAKMGSDDSTISPSVETEKYRKSRALKKHHSEKPKPPSKSQPPGPAYSVQPLSLLGYTQYFANLTEINAAFASGRHSQHRNFTYEVEYHTKTDKIYRLPDLTVRSYIDLATRIGDYKPKQEDVWLGASEESRSDASAAKKKKKKHKKKKEHKKKKGHQSRKAINKFWFTFVDRAYVGAKSADDIRDQFGMDLED